MEHRSDSFFGTSGSPGGRHRGPGSEARHPWGWSTQACPAALLLGKHCLRHRAIYMLRTRWNKTYRWDYLMNGIKLKLKTHLYIKIILKHEIGIFTVTLSVWLFCCQCSVLSGKVFPLIFVSVLLGAILFCWSISMHLRMMVPISQEGMEVTLRVLSYSWMIIGFPLLCFFLESLRRKTHLAVFGNVCSALSWSTNRRFLELTLRMSGRGYFYLCN